MKVRSNFYLLAITLGLIVIIGSMATAVSCSPAVPADTVTVPANTCPAVTGERGEDSTMIAKSDIKRERPLIDINAPVSVETATFSLG